MLRFELVLSVLFVLKAESYFLPKSAIGAKHKVPFTVYIEDTDTYGVVYNGNYMKYYDRALTSIMQPQLSNGDRLPIISEVVNQRFLSSPALGESVVIHAELIDVETDDFSNQSRWKVSLKSEDDESTFNSAELLLQPLDLLINHQTLQAETKESCIFHDEFQ